MPPAAPLGQTAFGTGGAYGNRLANARKMRGQRHVTVQLTVLGQGNLNALGGLCPTGAGWAASRQGT